MEAIWYVENDENDVFLLGRAFRRMGLQGAIRHFDCSDAFTQALNQALERNEIPRLFLFDLKLDAESGLDLLQHVRNEPRLKSIPAFIFSSGRVPRELVESMELEARAYIFKPASAEGWREVAEYLASTAGLSGPDGGTSGAEASSAGCENPNMG